MRSKMAMAVQCLSDSTICRAGNGRKQQTVRQPTEKPFFLK